MTSFKGLLRRTLPIWLQIILWNLSQTFRLPLILISDGILRLKFGHDAPRKYQILFVRPHDILFNRVGVGTSVPRGLGGFPSVVVDGGWDSLDDMNFQGVAIVDIVKKRINEGLTWDEAGETHRMLRILAGRGSADFCKSLDDIKRRNCSLDKLIAFVRVHRTLLSRRELAWLRFREMGGIHAVVARDGRLLLAYAGTHRLAIAQVLDAPVIPVAITLVHSESLRNGTWSALVARSRSLEKEYAELLKHPRSKAAKDTQGVRPC